MNYAIDNESSVPAYHQIYEMLRQDIINEIYSFGQKLPSKRVITAKTGVSVITVEHALAMLDEEGYIESKERSGYFVCYRKSDFGLYGVSNEVKAATNIPKEQNSKQGYYADITKGENAKSGLYADSATTDAKHMPGITHRDADISLDLLSKTMRRVILNYGDVLLEKSDNYGCDFLREEIQKYLARSRGIVVDKSQIIIGSGAEYLYGMLAWMFNDRERFAIEDPSYEKIRLVYEASNKNVIPLSIEDDGIPSKYLSELDADILHVTPFHSFPSGATADVSKRNEYIGWAVRNKAYLIEDNYDSELTVSRKSEETLFSMNGERVIYINTFSKTIAPSIRVGYMILPVHLLEKYDSLFGNYSCTVPMFEQLVVADLISSGNFERHINRVRRARRRALRSE